MLFAMRLPRTEVTLVYYRRKRCRLSVKRRRCSQNSAGYTNKAARLWPASVPVWRGLKCVEHAEENGLYYGLEMACVRSCRARHGVCGTCEGKLYMRTQKRDWDKTQPLNFLLLFFWCFFVCIRIGFRCICFGSRRFSLYVSFDNGSSSDFLIHNRLLY